MVVGGQGRPAQGVRTDGIEASTPWYGVPNGQTAEFHTNGAAPPAASSLSPTAVGTSGVVPSQVPKLLPTNVPTSRASSSTGRAADF